jgi:hypothetical protein
LCLPPWPQPIIEYGSSIQGRSQDGAKIEDFKYLSKGKMFLVLSLFLSPLCPRTSKHLSMREEVGTMQFRVQGSKKSERKRKNEYKYIYKKRKNIWVCMI